MVGDPIRGGDPALQLWNARTGSKIDFFNFPKTENMFERNASRPGRQTGFGSDVRMKHSAQVNVCCRLQTQASPDQEWPEIARWGCFCFTRSNTPTIFLQLQLPVSPIWDRAFPPSSE